MTLQIVVREAEPEPVIELHGSAVYRFGAENARLVPFLTAGAGESFLGDEDL